MSFEKLKLLIWKNFILQKRHKWQTCFEIACPVVFSMFLILVRCLVDPQEKPSINYAAFQPTYFDLSGSKLGTNNISVLQQEGTVAFSPNNSLIKKVVQSSMHMIAEDNFGALIFFLNPALMPIPKGYANAKELEKALIQPNAMDRILCGIQFEDNFANITEWPEHIKLTLRFPAVMRNPLMEHPIRASWRTNLLFPLFPRPGPREPEDRHGGKMPGYSAELFLAMQHAITREVIRAKTGKVIELNDVYLRRFPHHSYRDDKLLMALERFISMIIMLAFAYTFVNTVRMVTSEKELQLKETMTIMGLPSWLHWLAWFIKQFSFLLVSVVLVVILFKIPFKRSYVPIQSVYPKHEVDEPDNGFSVLTFVPCSILFFFMVLYMIASLTFSFMVSVFFSRANTAASFMGLAWLCTYSFFMMTQALYEDINTTTKVLLSLLSNTAMGYAFQMIVVAEGTSKGLQWKDLFKPVSYHDPFTPGHVAIMLILDAIIYMVIAMYVEKTRPGMYGVPLSWYFPFTKSYWCPVRNKESEITKLSGDLEYNDALLRVVHDEEPKGVRMGVNIKNLTKIFKGKKKAVDNLNLRMYENEITVLLGHNGAGKTTTISMLTGMVPPSSGSATINGYNIVTETELARKSLGICPQHNVLFPDMTVAEHIQFYSRLKGVPSYKIKNEVNHFVKLLELGDKRDVLSANLSGGQKRRLSVGAAMCGNSSVVLLDEPTSGLDPAARRALWDLLQKEKKGRTMILTTHFMDEADVLGDRIAIMSGGRLQCIGTPYFLKKHYGTGYKLTIVKGDHCDVDRVSQFFKKYMPDVIENTNIGSELTYILMKEHVAKFPGMLKEFEEVQESLNVASYGLSVTSLEEVFMKAGAEEFVEAETTPTRKKTKPRNKPVPMRVNMVKVNPRNGSADEITVQIAPNRFREPIIVPMNGHQTEIDFSDIHKAKGTKLLGNHIKAMFLKLFYSSMRSKLVAIIQCVTPVINIAISVLVSRSWKFMSELPPLELSLQSGFDRTETLISDLNVTEGGFEDSVRETYKDYFKSLKDPTMKLVDVGSLDLGNFYLKLAKEDEARVRYENVMGITFSFMNITAWFSNFGYHDPAIALSAVNNAIWRTLVPNGTFKYVNHPLPYSIDNLVKVMATGSSMGFQFAFNIGFCMAFVTAFLVLFVVKERLSGAKLLQRVSGVRPIVMWACAYFWDWLWLAFIYLFIIVPLALFQESTLASPAELGRIYLVLIVFSLAAIPQHYLASFFFESPASGFSKMCFVNMFLGCMPFLIIEVLRLPEVGSPYWAGIFDGIFSPMPIYCLSRSFRDLSVSAFAILACDTLCTHLNIRNCTRNMICDKMNISVCCIEDDPYLKWSEPGIGRYLVWMTLVGIVGFSILMLKEYGVFKMLCSRSEYRKLPPADTDEDSDVTNERAYVQAMSLSETAQQSLVCKDLTKYYKKLLAVNRLTFAVNKGECFGLLGVNGAGKTSTFRMLTGDAAVSAGDAFVHGCSVRADIRQVHQLIGYCPQFDALLDNLTARETLRIFSLLRGIPTEVGAERAESLANSLGFARHFDKKVDQCSGGTKRKISAAVALLGDSPLIYLDEPTTGMDPASKRLVWSSVSRAVDAGRSVVLTSHSMEECEALCSRLTVMVNGKLFCFGPLQHLKNKFSQGYTLTVKCKSEPDREANVSSANGYIMEHFPDSKLVESYLGISTYYLNDKGLPWWRVFDIMEKARESIPIEDYSVTQTTLEQVFLKFSKSRGDSD